MEMSWQESSQNRLQYERNLNFSTLPEVLDDANNQKKKLSRDPLSHRIIEKRRRDRMNNCLADLSRLIPSNFVKKSRGRIEKTEIIEMAIKHLKQLMFRATKHTEDTVGGNENGTINNKETVTPDSDRYCLGFQECMSETMYFLVEVDGFGPGEGLCMRLVNHLQKHLETIVKGPEDDRPPSEPHLARPKPCDMDDQDDVSSPHFDRFTPPSSTGTFNSGIEADEYYSSKPRTNSGGSSSEDIHMGDATIDQKPAEPIRCGHVDFDKRSAAATKNTEFGSQLREMLLLQNPTTGHVSRSTPIGQPESSLGGGGGGGGGGSNSSNSSHSIKSGSVGAGGDEVYKFKTDIKERFRADQKTTWTDGDCDSESESGAEYPEKCPSVPHRTQLEPNRKAVSTKQTIGNQERASSDLPTRPASMTTRRDNSPASPEVEERNNRNRDSRQVGGGHEIPIFALHPKGNFYIPMILDGELLEPYMREVASVSAQTLLHHIGISVYFSSGTIRVPWSKSAAT